MHTYKNPSTGIELPTFSLYLFIPQDWPEDLKYNTQGIIPLLASELPLPGATCLLSLHHIQPMGVAKKFSNPTRPALRIIQDSTTVLFRALGVYLIISAFKSLRHWAIGKGYDEPTKIAIRQSRTIALMRAFIHVVPVGVAMWEIIINWNTYYLGAVIRNQAYYQFGAKVHEMTAQASLAAIVFSYIRYEISLGNGLPFGALFSGLHVSQASYLWSMEFWGSICSKDLSVRRKIRMILIVTVAIFLAAVVGPSSAILLIPRLNYWPAGATNIWLNTTMQDLWPDRLVPSIARYAIELGRTNTY